MRALFISLLDMSVKAGWLVLAVCVFRIVFKRAPKTVRCILWGMVALRLVLPFSVESVLSVLPKTDPASFLTQSVSSCFAPDGPSQALSGQTVSYAFETQGAQAGPSADFFEWASRVWLAGSAIMLFYAAVSYIRLRRSVSEAVPAGKNVYECSGVSPFVLGIIRPRIYLPFSLSGSGREFVIAHERAHIKRGDHLYKPFGFLLLSVYWFNPLMWAAYVLLCRDIELACDERVVKNLTAEEKREYSRTLLSLSVSRRGVTACPVAFGENGIKLRVKNALSFKKPAVWLIIASVAVCAAITVCFLTDPGDKNAEEGYVPLPSENLETDDERLIAFDSVSWDIDGDGKKEKCFLGMGPTSGLFTFSLYAEKENSDLFYLDMFLSEWGELSFVKSADGKRLFVEIDGTVNSRDKRYYEIKVTDGKARLIDGEDELSHWGPSGVEAKAFLSGAYVEKTEDGYRNLNDTPWGITLRAENVTPTGMKLVFEQSGGENGDGLYITGQYYRIDVFEDGEWRPLENEGAFTTESIFISPGETCEWDLDWSDFYGELENSYSAGLYRVVKYVAFVDDPTDSSVRWEDVTQAFYAFFAV